MKKKIFQVWPIKFYPFLHPWVYNFGSLRVMHAYQVWSKLTRIFRGEMWKVNERTKERSNKQTNKGKNDDGRSMIGKPHLSLKTSREDNITCLWYSNIDHNHYFTHFSVCFLNKNLQQNTLILKLYRNFRIKFNQLTCCKWQLNCGLNTAGDEIQSTH